MCALIKTGGGISTISGKIGGTVFARNRGGSYMRNYTMPINPNSTKQQTVRANFATSVQQWRELTSAQQQAWTDMAPQYPYSNRVGDQAILSGEQLFIKLNQNLKLVDQSLLTSPLVPQSFQGNEITFFTMEMTAGVLTNANVELLDALTANEGLIITVTPGVSNGITKPPKSLFRKVFTYGTGGQDNVFDITTEYLALYGSPELDAKLFARVDLINTSTGQRLHLGQKQTNAVNVI